MIMAMTKSPIEDEWPVDPAACYLAAGWLLGLSMSDRVGADDKEWLEAASRRLVQVTNAYVRIVDPDAETVQWERPK